MELRQGERVLEPKAPALLLVLVSADEERVARFDPLAGPLGIDPFGVGHVMSFRYGPESISAPFPQKRKELARRSSAEAVDIVNGAAPAGLFARSLSRC